MSKSSINQSFERKKVQSQQDLNIEASYNEINNNLNKDFSEDVLQFNKNPNDLNELQKNIDDVINDID